MGPLRGFHGNDGCFVRCVRLRPLARGDKVETTVLSTDYLLARLAREGVADLLPLAYGRLCGHEFVLSGIP